MPSQKELWVVEPPTAKVFPPVRRVLSYPIEVNFSVAFQPVGPGHAPPSPPSSEDDDDDDPQARRRRHFRSPSPPRSPASGGPASESGTNGSAWRPVKERLGLGAATSTALHVATSKLTDTSASPGSKSCLDGQQGTLGACSQLAADTASNIAGTADRLEVEGVHQSGGQCLEVPATICEAAGLNDTTAFEIPAPVAPLLAEVGLSVASPTLEKFEQFGAIFSQDFELLCGPVDTSKPADTISGGFSAAHCNTSSGYGVNDSMTSPLSKAAMQQPQTPPSSPLPEFHQLVSPAGQLDSWRQNISTSQLKVYSRRRRPRVTPVQLDTETEIRTETSTMMATTEVPDRAPTASGVVVPLETPPAVDSEGSSTIEGGDTAVVTPSAVADLQQISTTTTEGVAVAMATPSLVTDPQQAVVAAGVVVPSETPPVAATTSTTREDFIARLAQHTASIMSAPATIKRSAKQVPPSSTPRRSRRLAGAQVEFQMDELDRRSKKKAMRTLQIINEQEGIDQQAQDEYAKL